MNLELDIKQRQIKAVLDQLNQLPNTPEEIILRHALIQSSHTQLEDIAYDVILVLRNSSAEDCQEFYTEIGILEADCKFPQVVKILNLMQATAAAIITIKGP